jgi:RND family efflux transporter MFP subunit
VRVRVTEVQKRQISIPVRSTGLLSASDEIKLSFKTGGIIASVRVKEGDRVRKGDLLASLDLSEINAAVIQARNGYDKAVRDLGRVENLYRDSVVTLEQKQNATTALEVAKANLDVAEFNLYHSKIIAPDVGIILKQLARKNELIAPGYPVFLFGSSGKQWKIMANLSDRDVVKVNPGDSASVHFDAWPGIAFPAVVNQVGGMSNPYTGTFEAEIQLKGPGYKLVSGFVAAVDIYPAKRNQFTVVPVSSIMNADGKNGYVYIVTDSTTAMKIRINIEMLADTLAAVSGLPGDIHEVVTGGAAYLRDGEKVTVVR